MELFEILNKRLLEESTKHYQGYAPGCNSRNYDCIVSTCVNKAYSKGYCNAHYIRWRKGLDLSPPIKNRKNGIRCSICGEKLNGKGGWNLCSKHYKQKRTATIRKTIIEYFGDECSRCGISWTDVCYDLHHKDGMDKIGGVSILIANSSIKKIAAEAIKCELVCANCHRIIHHG